MSTDPTLRVPMLVPGVDVRALPLGALEGFLLSRVDGALTLGELGEMTGLGSDAVTDIVARLVSLGAVGWKDGAPASIRPPRAPAAERNPERPKTPEGGARTTSSRAGMRVNPQPQTVIRALYDPIELEEDVELEVERRRRILDTFYQLDVQNYYQLLEIAPDADKATVRSAYFELSRIFHPDTMFRKRLGTYKLKMEVIFRRLTEAYETLGKKKTREAYDDYLAISEETQGAQRSLAEGDKVAAREAARVGATPIHGVPSVLRPNEVPPPPVAPASTPPPPPVSPAPAPPMQPAAAAPLAPEAPQNSPLAPAKSPSPPPPAAAPTSKLPSAAPSGAPNDEQRKRMQELLQYRLQSVSRDFTSPTKSAAPPPARPADPQAAGRELVRTLQETASITGTGDLASRHLAEGLQFAAEGKLVEAVNALSIARAIDGERPEIVAEYERVKKMLAIRLADTYMKQARYEEELGKWGQAALSWSRVCEGRPEDVAAHRRTAEALLKAKGDLHRARAYGQRAVELAPGDVKVRLALARVFIAAGLKLNAKRELEIAAKLDPGDDLVKNLLRELK